jgi:hypothetical protein
VKKVDDYHRIEATENIPKDTRILMESPILIALKLFGMDNVKKGEELTINYFPTFEDPSVVMK